MKKKNLSVKKKIHNFYFKKLEDPKIKKIYLKFKKTLSKYVSKNFCVAVSGGADSLALSILALKKRILRAIADLPSNLM